MWLGSYAGTVHWEAESVSSRIASPPSSSLVGKLIHIIKPPKVSQGELRARVGAVKYCLEILRGTSMLGRSAILMYSRSHLWSRKSRLKVHSNETSSKPYVDMPSCPDIKLAVKGLKEVNDHFPRNYLFYSIAMRPA